MKKSCLILLLCCMGFVYADVPEFEETDEKVQNAISIPFAADEPVFEEDDETEGYHRCDSEPKKRELDEDALLKYSRRFNPEGDDEQGYVSYVSWKRFKANFGFEKIFVRFPQRPAISQSNTLLTAYAYECGVMYSVVGYYPPAGSMIPGIFFDEILFNLRRSDVELHSSTVHQDAPGVWRMDYVAHDRCKELVIKARAIVTPFNCYIIQCIKPEGSRDYFNYFLESFQIRCDAP